MGEPAFKRPKLLANVHQGDDWAHWKRNLGQLQDKLLTGCLCNVDTIELQRPPHLPSTTTTSNRGDNEDNFPKEYTIQFISTINLLIDTALGQHAKSFICPKILDMATDVSTDEGIWELLLESLNSLDKFISNSTTKCLVSFLMWTKLPNLDEIFNDLFSNIFLESSSVSPMKLSHTLDVIRGVVEFKDIEEHPLGLQQQQQQEQQPEKNGDGQVDFHNSKTVRRKSVCVKIEVDSEIESEVRNMCIKSLESWWTRLLSKFHNLLSNYDDKNEAPILTFLSLWQCVISVKTNLSVIDTKQFHMQLEHFVPHLNASLPAVIWKKILDVFSEILCYGSTLSLQDELAEEPCNLAHLIIRCVKNRQFLQGVPYTRTFSGFGGSSFGPVDWEWESENPISLPSNSKLHDIKLSVPPRPLEYSIASSSSSSIVESHQPFTSDFPASSKSCFLDKYNSSISSSRVKSSPFSGPKKSNTLMSASLSNSPGTSNTNVHNNSIKDAKVTNSVATCSSSQTSNKSNNSPVIHSTIYIGPSLTSVRLDENYEDSDGDRPFLQKLVLVVFKSIAVTVKETRAESDSDDSASNSSSGSESDGNDMVIIERSIREVLQQVDAFVKSLLPFHPATPLGEWMVNLFSDQDDALVEAMLCALDTFTGFHARIQPLPYFYRMLNPVVTFIAFARTVSEDRDILLDLLMSNETSFLLYFLRFLKFSWKNWAEFVSTCGRDLEKIMGLLIRLRIAIGRLVEKSLFPYNINPLLRLLERCESKYESSNVTTNS